MTERCFLTRDEIDGPALLRRVQSPHCGANVLFLGTVRDLTGPDVTAALDYDAYEAMAERVLAGIVGTLQVGGVRVEVVHRLGHVAVGETSVAVAVSAPHRARAFDVAREVLEAHQGRRARLEARHRPGFHSAAWQHPEPPVRLVTARLQLPMLAPTPAPRGQWLATPG